MLRRRRIRMGRFSRQYWNSFKDKQSTLNKFRKQSSLNKCSNRSSRMRCSNRSRRMRCSNRSRRMRCSNRSSSFRYNGCSRCCLAVLLSQPFLPSRKALSPFPSLPKDSRNKDSRNSPHHGWKEQELRGRKKRRRRRRRRTEEEERQR